LFMGYLLYEGPARRRWWTASMVSTYNTVAAQHPRSKPYE
jgi:hypothetical protein